jgi:hypothetical protein
MGRRLLVVAGVVSGFALTALPAASAQAALISTSACDNSALSSPFARWGDGSLYKLVPGSDFEGSLAGWTLTGGAHTVAGSEPYAATGSAGSSSLSLAAGASAQTPFTCVNAAYPTFRFFARNDAALSSILVSVVYRSPIGAVVAVPVGTVALSQGWQPSLPMLTASAVEGALSGGTTQVALRFTAVGGTSQIDDVFVDPRVC